MKSPGFTCAYPWELNAPIANSAKAATVVDTHDDKHFCLRIHRLPIKVRGEIAATVLLSEIRSGWRKSSITFVANRDLWCGQCYDASAQLMTEFGSVGIRRGGITTRTPSPVRRFRL